jgi:hypothetical protein
MEKKQSIEIENTISEENGFSFKSVRANLIKVSFIKHQRI